ncbi:MAG TPA: hydroxyacid dehydrogenase [Clostridiales bacterium]|nr:hydroxyacid dehydrogenase [Clostridiales bacterium]
MNGIFMTSGGTKAIERAYDRNTRDILSKELHFFEGLFDINQIDARKDDLKNVDCIFSTWGMFTLSHEQIQEYLPRLKAVFYAAGSVQYFARPFLDSSVRIFSAYAANAVPVAEYTTAQILLAGKGYFLAERLYKTKGFEKAREYMALMPGNYGEKVGILGAGAIGRLVIASLKNYNYQILVFDPFLSQEKADEMGVKKTDLNEIFRECLIISNHIANNENTRGMLKYEHFSLMRPNAVFINTGRGAQVIEADLVRALTEVPTRAAVLDVTHPEPVQPGHPFYTMENVFLTPHIAGSIGDEIARMGQYMLQEYKAFSGNMPCKYEVTMEMLKTMA